MQTKTVDVHQSRVPLAELVRLAREGAEVVLSEDGKPLARVVSIAALPKRRTPGLHAGAISTADDFDEPLDERFWSRE